MECGCQKKKKIRVWSGRVQKKKVVAVCQSHASAVARFVIRGLGSSKALPGRRRRVTFSHIDRPRTAIDGAPVSHGVWLLSSCSKMTLELEGRDKREGGVAGSTTLMSESRGRDSDMDGGLDEALCAGTS